MELVGKAHVGVAAAELHSRMNFSCVYACGRGVQSGTSGLLVTHPTYALGANARFANN